jgi:hypothetical protein
MASRSAEVAEPSAVVPLAPENVGRLGWTCWSSVGAVMETTGAVASTLIVRLSVPWLPAASAWSTTIVY